MKKIINMSNNPEAFMISFWRRFLQTYTDKIDVIDEILQDVKAHPDLYRVDTSDAEIR